MIPGSLLLNREMADPPKLRLSQMPPARSWRAARRARARTMGDGRPTRNCARTRKMPVPEGSEAAEAVVAVEQPKSAAGLFKKAKPVVRYRPAVGHGRQCHQGSDRRGRVVLSARTINGTSRDRDGAELPRYDSQAHRNW